MDSSTRVMFGGLAVLLVIVIAILLIQGGETNKQLMSLNAQVQVLAGKQGDQNLKDISQRLGQLELKVDKILKNSPPPPSPPPPPPSSAVLINEVELNPPCDDRLKTCMEEVELYNPNDTDVAIGGWTLVTTHGDSVTLLQGTVVKAEGYYVVEYHNWLNNDNESVTLMNASSQQVDQTPTQSDTDNQDNPKSWQRCPNGASSWVFGSSTLGTTNAC